MIPFSNLSVVDENALSPHENNLQSIGVPPPLSMDLAEEIKGLYRLSDVISEYRGHGYGNGRFGHATRGLADLPST